MTEQEEFEEHMQSRCDPTYQKQWRELIVKEKQWAVVLKKQDKIFGYLLEVWISATEAILDYVITKYFKVKITSYGDKTKN